MRLQNLKTGLAAVAFALAAGGSYHSELEANGFDHVNPFIGTGGHGHTFPGATTPHGMVQLSPDTRLLGWDACGGYHYSDTSILGFTHTHLSGTGIGDLGDILFMPFIGEPKLKAGEPENPDSGYRSRFSHDEESAEPGYYSVTLSDYDIDVELTASTRAGFHRYSYPKGEDRQIIIDLDHTLMNHRRPITELRVINDREIVGYKRTRGWARNHHVYFHAKFSEPFEYTLYENGKEYTGKFAVAAGNTKIVLNFGKESKKAILAKVGISSVDHEGARQNLESEIAGWNFDAVRKDAKRAWTKQLDRIRVKGGTDDEKEIFYTALYHTAISPYQFTDVDGRYRGMDQGIHKADDDSVYTVFSLWDTFRAAHPLLTITEPELNEAFIRSLLTNYDQGGMLPKWELAGNYTGTMIGSHAISVIVDAYMKGYRDFDVEKAYEAMKASIHYRSEDDFLYPDHRIQEKLNPMAKKYNDELGFIPCDLENESVSKALEYAYNDWCMAQMAKALGKRKDAAMYEERAKRYEVYYDAETGFMRGKNKDGSWKTPFDPRYSKHREDEYTEGNAWQWTWFVPHDVDGLVDLMGGKKPFVKKLDELFSTTSEMVGEHVSNDISGLIGQYAHGNEPSHHTTHIYNFVGEAWKTQELVDEIMSTLYFADPNGLSGNEDCGQMSAWYILNAMGFYSFCPGDSLYSLGRPIFDEVEVPLPNGKTFRVTVENNGPENKYIQSVTLNGESLDSPFFTHEQLTSGGTLKFVMGPKPNKKAFTS
ncbi:GH92 family glycosyl hydrolase [Pelagicoccus mobilis]|uniref:GH92 family glycosyl hydrolase n=1 Tax=Pelagicoccus mobilis TaxID=415221 RepID=A0A934VTM0_9BACT|nr:GH92 family glycosyl hydrolase [Pelagicoccus mobilis]MBK1879863.1 GH92 family glycosyl hydrolase [Pelagicoccus mobilis]